MHMIRPYFNELGHPATSFLYRTCSVILRTLSTIALPSAFFPLFKNPWRRTAWDQGRGFFCPFSGQNRFPPPIPLIMSLFHNVRRLDLNFFLSPPPYLEVHIFEVGASSTLHSHFRKLPPPFLKLSRMFLGPETSFPAQRKRDAVTINKTLPCSKARKPLKLPLPPPGLFFFTSSSHFPGSLNP